MKIVTLGGGGGGGGVGSSAAFNLLLQADPHDVVLVDCRAEMVDSHVLDLEQVLELGAAGSVRGGGLDDVLDADVVVVTASEGIGAPVARVPSPRPPPRSRRPGAAWRPDPRR